MQPNMNPYGAPQYPSPGYGYGPPPSAWGANPYGPPTFVPAGSGGFAVKWVALASMVTVIGSSVLTFATMRDWSDVGDDGMVNGGPPSALEIVGPLVLCCALFAWALSCLTWVYKSWEFLPFEYRRTAAGKAISPGSAIGFMFIPLFNLYWGFAQNLGYCDALDSALAQNGHTARAPRSLATVCSALQVIPYLNFALAPIMWLVYMFVADAAKSHLRTAR